mmetsp:Transcript_130080/g.277879  ORF Transcript_130080/g.277879 Transcript_130080/m.277879 type:complete len:489 (+) Transcript_130080:164-1630(+)
MTMLLCAALLVAAILPWQSRALLTAVGADGVAPASATAALPLLLPTVSLQKQYVPVIRGNKTVAYKTAYFGSVQVGNGSETQTFTVVFDTGSGHFILPSTSCASETCLKHRRYNRSSSTSAVDIEYDGTPIRHDALERDQVAIAFGTGEVLGEFVQEAVCLRAAPAEGEASAALNVSSPCVNLRVVLATDMTPDPFGLFAFDGVLGLGLDALTLDPHFSLISQMVEQHQEVLPRFAVFLARNDGGESTISFGGHDTRRATSELQWAPVAMKELGYWQVQIKAVRVGNSVLDYCADGTCRAILDTGTSLLGVPRPASRPMHRLLARQVPDGSYDEVSNIDCRTVPGQMVEFDLGNGVVVSLGVEDYSRPTPFNMTIPGKNTSRLFCRSLMLPVDMEAPLGPKVFIWGEPVLRRYYTVYDWSKKEIGFTLAQQDEGEESRGLPSVGAPPVGSLLSGAPLGPIPRTGATAKQGASAVEVAAGGVAAASMAI